MFICFYCTSLGRETLYWEKIIHQVDCITDVPPSRWDVEAYYDPDPRAADKTYCKRGGFIPDIDFNPMEFGLPPNLLEVTDVSQLLSLVVAKEAIADAGYGESRQFNRERTGVILGVALARQLTTPLGTRLQYPVWEKVLKSSGLSDQDTQKIIEKIKLAYVKWEENAFPGMLANVVAGRIANRLDLGGMNCVVDAACASSLGALSMAISELTEYRSDMMITGGVDTDNSIIAYMCFSKTPALSLNQSARPFDVDSDGMMMGEGIGMMVIKRLEDAERDNDRIYAVIKGIGTSSDGRDKSIYAPRPEGQVRALRRAYENAGLSPLSVGLIEAHGTGTMAGDTAEFTALKEFFGEHNPQVQNIALGSVKSQIGHTKAAAGAASLIKTALALHHKVLPPTLKVTKPHPKLNVESSAFYLNTETRPWLHVAGEGPRRAGVSSFGFGGTNYHVILEEYSSEHQSAYRLHNTPQSVLLFASTPAQLLTQCQDLLLNLQSDAGERHYVALVDACKSLDIPVTDARVGFVANSLTEACKLLQTSIDWLRNKAEAQFWQHPQGISYRQTGINPQGKVVALFSGQGSQYLEMGRELTINFPCLRQAFGYMDSLLSQDGLTPLSDTVFPRPVFDTTQRHAQVDALTRTEYAQPAIGAFSVGLYKILQQAGFKPDFVAGHSFGELTALWAAEVLSDEDYFFLVKARGQAMATPNDPNVDAGAMLAVMGDVLQVEAVVKDFPQVTIANLNSNTQVVLAGAKSEITKVQKALTEQGLTAVLLSVSAAFHTPLVAQAQKPFAEAIEGITFRDAKIPVYTNVTGKRYPTEPKSLQKTLKEHLINSVVFKREIENIYADGGYFFIEFGPRNILTNLVKDILGEQPHLAVALNGSRQKDSDRQLREAVMQLRVAGLTLTNLDPYQVPAKTPEANKSNMLTVRLNSSNFVSEKSKLAFETALRDGHQVNMVDTLNGSEAKPAPIANGIKQSEKTEALILATTRMTESPEPMMPPQPSPEPKRQPMIEMPLNYQTTPEPHRQPMTEMPLNYQRVLESLEYSMEKFNHHQGDILQVHEQSLQHQTEYAKTFFQLMQQQNMLFANGKSAAQPPQTQGVVIQSSERSMMRFHHHQAETLRIHEHYLKHQMDYANNFFQLLQQQYDVLINGDSTAHAKPFVSFQDSHAAIPTTAKETELAKQDSPQRFSTAPIAVSTNGHVTSPNPVASNGSSNGSNGSTLVQASLVALAEGEAKSYAPTLDNLMSAPPESTATLFTPPAVAIDFSALSETLLAVVSEKTGYPVQMLELSMDMEADLGIDSIKRVEILGALLELFPDLPRPNPEDLAELRTIGQIVDYMQQQGDSVFTIAKETDLAEQDSPQLFITAPIAVSSNGHVTSPDPAVSHGSSNGSNGSTLVQESLVTVVPTPDIMSAPPESAATLFTPPLVAIDISALSETLLAVVSEKTGYPVQMLELSMDMEADLGIDSIKRVEILGALLELFPDLPRPNPEDLAELRTIGQIVEYLQQQADSAEKIILQNEPESQQPEQNHHILRSPVRLKVLPEPDFLDFTLPENHIGLLTDDGSLTTSKLAAQLTERGWKVVVLSFPQSLIADRSPLPTGMTRVVLEDLSEEHLKQQLVAIAAEHGAIGAFIHLNPVSQDVQSQEPRYLEVEKALLKQVFLLAKHLKQPLNEAARQGHSCFLTVAHLDGELGTGGKTNFGAIGGGLFGLTKSLNQEWEPVFCRALDLSPDLDTPQSVQCILTEIHDPNRLITEVGYSLQGRTTLVC